MYDHTFYKQVRISRSDIRPHKKWAVSLVILHMITSIFLRALCGYIWVNILTLSPRGETTVDIFKLEFISIRFTTFFTLTKISNTKKHQISAYRPFENVSLLYIYFQWVAAATLRTKFPLITSKKCARLLRHVIGHYKIDALTTFFLRL